MYSAKAMRLPFEGKRTNHPKMIDMEKLGIEPRTFSTQQAL
jgi:hypothetical protein